MHHPYRVTEPLLTLPTREVAAVLRRHLRRAYGRGISVRCSRGTASAMIKVTLPPEVPRDDVQRIVGVYEGRRFNAVTDGYDETSNVLEVDGVLYRPVCDGVNISGGLRSE